MTDLGSACRVLVLTFATATLAGSATGALAQAGPPAAAAPVASAEGTLSGRVIDAVTGAPVPGVTVRFPALGRSNLSGTDGSFVLRGVPVGAHTLTLQRVGYAPAEAVAEVVAGGETSTVEVSMRPTALELAGLVVTASGAERRTNEVFQPVSTLSGAELRARLGASVAATIAGEPGITERYNGPAASQPVIRGLSGDRVLILEDGNRTGDVSSTSADHAVSVDPAGASRIEVVRGPAGLLYGSNALGGVINVIRDDVPRTLPERISGRVGGNAGSVNGGVSGSGELRGAVGEVAWRAALSGRTAGDTRTPLGDLPSTGLSGREAGFGAAWVRPAGFAGVAIRDFALEYGVPGSFGDATIPGAHEEGVEIEMRRVSGTGTAARVTSWGPFSSMTFDATYAWYLHREIEDGGVVGTEFGQLSGTGRLVARHRHEGDGFQREGAVGLWTSGRDFNVAGSNTGSRPAREYVAAAFGYEELEWDRFRLQFGGRYDRVRVDPEGESTAGIGDVRTRDFSAFTGSASAILQVVPDLGLGVTGSRAFRAPSIEELFSEGPHLADFSYNVGNPDLEPEYGHGVDVFLRYTRPGARAEAGVFHNQISDFVFYAPTGELDPRFNRYPVYQASQTRARLRGAEAAVEWEIAPSLVVHASGSYVEGERMDEGAPLPEIPPLQGTVGARYETPGWFALASWRGATRQDRVAENELATDGYSLLGAGGGIRWSAWGGFHSLTLMVDNVADTVWRDHLSRARAVAPQPGRDVRLVYQYEF